MSREESKEKKRKIFALRLQGSSITAIAKECDCSRQYVDKVLNNFDRIEVDEKLVFQQLPYNAVEIAVEISSSKSSETDKIAEEIMRKEAEVATVVWYLTENRNIYHKPKSESYFSAVSKWRKETNTSIKTLAEKCNVGTARLQLILAGIDQMPYSLAVKICDITGIEMKELFADIIQIGYVYNESEDN